MTDDEFMKVQQTITAAKDNFEDLTEWEQGFMVSTEERVLQYGQDIRMSPKQWGVIDRVYDKLVGD